MHDARLAGQQYEVTAPQEGPRLPVQARLSLVPTAAVSDALDRLGLPGSLHGLGGLREGQSACGPAFTARYEPVDDSGGTVGDFLDDVPAGAVVVIDNGGSTTETVWGGIMTRIAAANGVAGTVINGVCRDTAASAAVGYSTWSAGRFMRTGKDRVRLHAVQEPVSINGVTIRPGDVVVGDDDGVVVVPVERAEEVAELAERIEAVEAAILTAVAAGSSLTQARREHGYHALQTRDSNQVTA
ncbi:RraA family protein [Kineococcus endophyticus]